jgi:hypothetical protein
MSDFPTPIPARELTSEEAQELAERAYELQEAIVAGMKVGREAAWAVAEQLHAFDEMSGWLALGYDTLSDWLAQPEVQVTTRTYYRLVQAYRETVVRRRIPLQTMASIDHSKIDVVIGRVNSGDVRIEDALEDAKVLGWRDLRQKYLKRRPEFASAGIPDHDDEPPADQDAEVRPRPAVSQRVGAALADDDVVEVSAQTVEPDHNPAPGLSGRLPGDIDALADSIDRALDVRASRATMVRALQSCKRYVAGMIAGPP